MVLNHKFVNQIVNKQYGSVDIFAADFKPSVLDVLAVAHVVFFIFFLPVLFLYTDMMNYPCFHKLSSIYYYLFYDCYVYIYYVDEILYNVLIRKVLIQLIVCFNSIFYLNSI